MVVLNAFFLVYLTYNCYFRDKKLGWEKEDGQLQSDLNDVKEEKDLCADKVPLELRLTTIQKKLDKNCMYAAEQQAKETAKGFIIKEEFLPETIKVGLVYPEGHEGYEERAIHGEEQELNGMKVGIASCQGARMTMEDANIAIHHSFKVNDIEHSFNLFGVFDGHAGDQASTYVKTNITQYLKDSLEEHNPESLTDAGTFKALKACCQKLDADYKGVDGTTATITVILNDKIWVANVGDSRTILVKDGQALQASEDAKPGLERYKKTIQKLGGYVVNHYYWGDRVNGKLTVARAIGHKDIMGKDGKRVASLLIQRLHVIHLKIIKADI